MNQLAEPYGFIKEIRDNYLVNVQALNEKLDSIFSDYNKVALNNIMQIMTVVKSEECEQLIREIGEIPVYCGKFDSISEHRDKLLYAVEGYRSNPKVGYYYNALNANDIDHDFVVKVSYGGIEIDGHYFDSVSSLYESIYRFFFCDFDYPAFVKAVKKYFEKIGVCECTE